MPDRSITIADLIEIPTAMLLQALKAKKELEGKTAEEITEMIDTSVASGRSEAQAFLSEDE